MSIDNEVQPDFDPGSDPKNQEAEVQQGGQSSRGLLLRLFGPAVFSLATATTGCAALPQGQGKSVEYLGIHDINTPQLVDKMGDVLANLAERQLTHAERIRILIDYQTSLEEYDIQLHALHNQLKAIEAVNPQRKHLNLNITIALIELTLRLRESKETLQKAPESARAEMEKINYIFSDLLRAKNNLVDMADHQPGSMGHKSAKDFALSKLDEAREITWSTTQSSVCDSAVHDYVAFTDAYIQFRRDYNLAQTCALDLGVMPGVCFQNNAAIELQNNEPESWQPDSIPDDLLKLLTESTKPEVAKRASELLSQIVSSS